MKRAVIIGRNAIGANIAEQFRDVGYDVAILDVVPESSTSSKIHSIIKAIDGDSICSCDDIVLISADGTSEALDEDNKVIRLLKTIAQNIGTDTRPRVHLLLQSQEALWMLNTRDYKDDLHQKLELYAFTIEDVWAKNVLVSMPKKQTHSEKSNQLCCLDYEPITYESNQTVHLVVLGKNEQAEALVKNAALVAHYPNYIRNHKLRTRITLIDKDMEAWMKSFVSRHQSLLDNSYYRHIDVYKKTFATHKPLYDGIREDFVDVEWEFVNGDIYDMVVQDKLATWAEDNNQVLSVAICNDNDSTNITQMRIAADLLQHFTVPVYVQQKDSTITEIISLSSRFDHVIPFGMRDNGYDVSLPLLQMAKRVKFVYDFCYDFNISNTSNKITAPSYIDEAAVERGWISERTAVKRYSNISNAMTLATKMRSLGHKESCWKTFYAISQKEVSLIAQVEHNRWNVEELMLGFRPCSDEEQDEIEKDISKKSLYKQQLVHYDLRAYSDLRTDATGKNVNTYDICLSASIPLIVHSVTDIMESNKPEKGGEA